MVFGCGPPSAKRYPYGDDRRGNDPATGSVLASRQSPGAEHALPRAAPECPTGPSGLGALGYPAPPARRPLAATPAHPQRSTGPPRARTGHHKRRVRTPPPQPRRTHDPASPQPPATPTRPDDPTTTTAANTPCRRTPPPPRQTPRPAHPTPPAATPTTSADFGTHLSISPIEHKPQPTNHPAATPPRIPPLPESPRERPIPQRRYPGLPSTNSFVKTATHHPA
jgi:hypothetical protein